MTCCVPTIIPFVNVASSTISYPNSLKALYGDFPKIEILYYDTDAGEYVVATPLEETRVAFTGAQIKVDHGGLQTGLIKLT